MTQPIKPEVAILNLVPLPRDLERAFHAGIKDRSPNRALFRARQIGLRVGQGKLRGERWRHDRPKKRIQLLGFAVVRLAKTGPRHDREKAKVGVRIGKLMEAVDPKDVVILEN